MEELYELFFLLHYILQQELNKHFLDNKYKYKKDAVIVDVGISRDETGLHGDALPNLPVRLQTPVPGGVGLLTRLSLMENLIRIYKSKH